MDRYLWCFKAQGRISLFMPLFSLRQLVWFHWEIRASSHSKVWFYGFSPLMEAAVQVCLRISPSHSRLENSGPIGWYLCSVVWNADATQKELKCSPFPVPLIPHSSSAPTAREGQRRTGKLEARWRTRSWSTGQGDYHKSASGSFCCSFASLPFRTSILLLSSLCQNIQR